ncbi:hypothetical protein PTI98_002197 [Pleurotus ostreatus]|nr:hypothetical protein PTI98_002197 [Pleurotus ostreatus]
MVACALSSDAGPRSQVDRTFWVWVCSNADAGAVVNVVVNASPSPSRRIGSDVFKRSMFTSAYQHISASVHQHISSAQLPVRQPLDAYTAFDIAITSVTPTNLIYTLTFTFTLRLKLDA